MSRLMLPCSTCKRYQLRTPRSGGRQNSVLLIAITPKPGEAIRPASLISDVYGGFNVFFSSWAVCDKFMQFLLAINVLFPILCLQFGLRVC